MTSTKLQLNSLYFILSKWFNSSGKHSTQKPTEGKMQGQDKTYRTCTTLRLPLVGRISGAEHLLKNVLLDLTWQIKNIYEVL